MTVSLNKPLEWATSFFFGNTELSLELWTVVAGISGFDDQSSPICYSSTVVDTRVTQVWMSNTCVTIGGHQLVIGR